MSDDQFYEQNAQCWRCRMYVPRVEMKYHAGMLYCPICYQDVVEGNRCQICGESLEYGRTGLCHGCRERKRAEKERQDARGQEEQRERCPRCGSLMRGGICPRCSRGEAGGGDSGIRCSECGQAAKPVTWHGGEPLCPACLERRKEHVRAGIINSIRGFIKDITGR